MCRTGLLLLLVIGLSPPAPSQSTDSTTAPRFVVSARRTPEPLIIDGSLSEGSWLTAIPWTVFTQREPVERAPATEKTEVRILYDDAALYVGARMLDSAPDSIVARLNRKDAQPNSDLFVIYIDSYHDLRSGFYFGLDAAGTFYDGVLTNDNSQDNTWDGVWEGAVGRDSLGWTAEFRIPFSQLRFQETSIWGVNFERDISRKREEDYVVFTPKNGSGFVSRFAELVGIDAIRPPARFEILPYLTMKAEYSARAPGDPFNNGSRYTPGVGGDIKIGIGTNLTLDATINPDFGQVEVDPAVVNLSDVETFFDEKRPFFLEGATIFNFGRGGARNTWSFNFPSLNILYSRRIGRTPQGSIPAADFSDAPLGTKILGAAKLTGKVGENWSLGSIQALTARENAEVQTGAVRSAVEIEPLTYYGVLRGLKEFSDGRQGLGVLSTVTSRMFRDDRLRDELSSSATVVGLDGWSFLDHDKEWVVTGSAIGSYVRGNTTRMLALQTNPTHYFQRPDAGYSRVDSGATSMTGYATRFWLVKQKGNVIFNAGLGVIHPNFEINDLGFLGRTSIINAHVGGGYSWVEPTPYYRELMFIGAIFGSKNFDGNTTWQGYFLEGNAQLPNYMNVDLVYAYNPQTINDRRTRGGPLTLNPPGYEWDLQVSTDNRKDIVASLFGFTYQADYERATSVNLSLEWRPASNVSLSLGPSLEINKEYTQWIGLIDDPLASQTFGHRYIFGTMDQKTIAANIRVNWTFTPRLSLQIFVQPLISSGKFQDIKEVARPGTFEFNHYGVGPSTISFQNGTYEVDPDGSGPALPFSFSNPDYRFVSLRGNAVLRWEFFPGSTLFFVWTQSRSQFDDNGEFQFDRSVRELLDAHPDNIFLMKISYWWN